VSRTLWGRSASQSQFPHAEFQHLLFIFRLKHSKRYFVDSVFLPFYPKTLNILIMKTDRTALLSECNEYLFVDESVINLLGSESSAPL